MKKILIIFPVLSAGGMLTDIFLINENTDLLTLFFMITLIISVYIYKISAKRLFKISALLLVLCPVFILFQEQLIANKISSWFYLLLIIGIFKIIFENKKR